MKWTNGGTVEGAEIEGVLKLSSRFCSNLPEQEGKVKENTSFLKDESVPYGPPHGHKKLTKWATKGEVMPRTSHTYSKTSP